MPQGFNYLLADRSRQMTMQEWEQLGIRRVGGLAFPRPEDRAYLLVPAGVQGPGFLMLHNFRVIMKYNPAEAYALAIGHLADRLRGGEAFVQSWPRHERVLTREERRELQDLLGGAASTPASRPGGSAPRPGRRCVIFRRRSASFRTVSRRRPCSPACGARDAER